MDSISALASAHCWSVGSASLSYLGAGQDQRQLQPGGVQPAPVDLGLDLVIGRSHAKGRCAAVEQKAGQQGVRTDPLDVAKGGVDGLQLLLDDLVAHAAGVALQVDRRGLQLGRHHLDALHDRRPLDGGSVDQRGLAQIALVEPAPGRRGKDADRHRDGQREAGHDQLLGAQLVLPAGTVLPVEDRSVSE